MRVLVTAASKHGATAEIATEIGRALAEQAVDVDVTPIEDTPGIGDYDAVVLGSAVYVGHWLKSATEFVEDHSAELAERPVWLFSSGPVGEPPKPPEEPVDAADMVTASAAREHRVFSGRLDSSQLGFAERAIVTALHAPEGDYRDWGEIRAWAAGIAESLATPAGSVRS
ncbi:MAG TPA: flavodoxin domain-containing protein [Actinomycetes bacterium]|nr:flavodoxin domain-containing protein [Actinomycetes bacterium]